MNQRLPTLGGIVGPATFVTCWALAGAATGGYSPVDRAISDCTKAIRFDPKNFTAHRVRGQAFEKKGDQPRAEADAAEAVRLRTNRD